VFDGILKGMTGGDRKVVNPDGSVSTIPSSRADMGKAIVAAALTGLMTPTHYRQTPYGPAIDYSAGMADAAARGKQTMQDYRNAPQKLSDDEESRRLMHLQNNVKLFQLKMSSSALQHQHMDALKPFIADMRKPFDDYQTEKSDPSMPDAYLQQGLTHQQALQYAQKNPEKGVTQANYMQDGWLPAGFDPDTHEQTWQPSYAIINPALKDIKIPENVAKRLSETNIQFQDIHKLVGGDVRLPVNAYISAMHDYEAVMTGQTILDRLNESLHPEDAKAGNLKPVNIAPVVKNSANRQQLLKALYDLHSNIAGGMSGLGKSSATNPAEPTTEGETPEGALTVILKQAPELLKALGITTKEAEDQINHWKVTQQNIKNTGTLKQAASDAEIKTVQDAANSLPDADQKKTVLSYIPTDGPTPKAELDKARTQLATFQRANEAGARQKALHEGDPVVMAQTATNIMDGALGDIKDLASYRDDRRAQLSNAVVAEAQKRNLNTANWGETALLAKSKMWNSYHSADKQTDGAQITAFRTFLDHTDDALRANDTWDRSKSPLFNKPLSWIAENAKDDPNWVAYKESFLPVAKEFMNFLNQNRAEHEADIQAMEKILNLQYSPREMNTVLNHLAQSADKRMAELAFTYNSQMGVTMPEMLTPQSKDTLDRTAKATGQASKSTALIQRLSRPTAQGQAPSVAQSKVFLQAASGDQEIAKEMARQAGFNVPRQ
jgi:hypothetical protein